LSWEGDTLVLPALSTYTDVRHEPRATRELPLLGLAAREVGALQIQHRGTWAGNVANASPAADGVPALLAYDARVTLASVRGRRARRGAARRRAGRARARHRAHRRHPLDARLPPARGRRARARVARAGPGVSAPGARRWTLRARLVLLEAGPGAALLEIED